MTPVSSSRPIDGVEPFNQSSYAQIDLTGLVAFALKWLQDRHIPTTFENVVIVVFKMFPNKFSLQGYQEYPDAARVNRSLLQLTPKYRNWARGSVQKGFILTEKGIAKVAEVEMALSTPNTSPPPKSTKRKLPLRSLDLEKELSNLKNSVLYDKWENGVIENATVLEFLDMLGAYAYTPPRALRDRLLRLDQTATQLNQKDVILFLKSVRKAFSNNLRDQ